MEVTGIVDKLVVRIYDKPVEDKEASETEGRPVFKNVVYIEKRINQRETYDQPMKLEDRKKYADLYDKFKSGEKAELEGWMISEWPRISVTQIAELKAQNIFTVEQLAGLDASQLPRGYMELQAKAKSDLSADSQIEELKKRIASLEAENEKLSGNQKKRPGRPRKTA